MKTVIITGCAGFIGNHLVRYLLNCGYRVIGIDDLSNGNLDFLPKVENFIFYQFSLSVKDITVPIFEQIQERYKPTAVFHLAANGYDTLSPFIRHNTYSNNMLSYANLINECIKYKLKIIFASSLSIYGDKAPPFSEQSYADPTNPESISKYAIELDIISASNQFDVKYNILRFGNIIGAYHNLNNPYKNIFSIFCARAIKNQDIIIYGNGAQTRSYLDVQYCLGPMELLIESHHNQIFNIGADKYTQVNAIADLFIKTASNYNLKISKKYHDHIYESTNIFCDTSKAKRLLNFEDKTDLYQVADSMLIWSLSQNCNEYQIADYELRNKIYEFWPAPIAKNNVDLEVENKEYFKEGSKRYRKSYG